MTDISKSAEPDLGWKTADLIWQAPHIRGDRSAPSRAASNRACPIARVIRHDTLATLYEYGGDIVRVG